MELRVREAMSVQAEAQTVPVLVEGALSLRKGPEVRAGVLMPPTLAGWQQFLALAPTSGEKFTDLKKAGVPVFAYGSFLTILVNFVLLAFIIFVMVKQINRLRPKEEPAAAPAEPPPPPEDIVLLREIRDALKR